MNEHVSFDEPHLLNGVWELTWWQHLRNAMLHSGDHHSLSLPFSVKEGMQWCSENRWCCWWKQIARHSVGETMSNQQVKAVISLQTGSRPLSTAASSHSQFVGKSSLATALCCHILMLQWALSVREGRTQRRVTQRRYVTSWGLECVVLTTLTSFLFFFTNKKISVLEVALTITI